MESGRCEPLRGSSAPSEGFHFRGAAPPLALAGCALLFRFLLFGGARCLFGVGLQLRAILPDQFRGASRRILRCQDLPPWRQRAGQIVDGSGVLCPHERGNAGGLKQLRLALGAERILGGSGDDEEPFIHPCRRALTAAPHLVGAHELGRTAVRALLDVVSILGSTLHAILHAGRSLAPTLLGKKAISENGSAWSNSN